MADTLTQTLAPIIAADSAQTGVFPAFSADSLFIPAPRAAESPFRSVSPEEIFGTLSQMVVEPAGAGYVPAKNNILSSDAVFQLSVLFLAAGYCAALYFFRSSALALIKIPRSKMYADQMLGQTNYTFNTFLACMSLLGTLALSVATVKVADIFLPLPWKAALPVWVSVSAVPLVAAALASLRLFSRMALHIAGAVTASGGFTSRLWQLRRLVFSFCTLVLTPVLLMLALGGQGNAVYAAPLLTAGIAAAIFLSYKTYMLFREENVSILHWFLYICAVEIFPVSLVVSLIYRYI